MISNVLKKLNYLLEIAGSSPPISRKITPGSLQGFVQRSFYIPPTPYHTHTHTQTHPKEHYFTAPRKAIIAVITVLQFLNHIEN